MTKAALLVPDWHLPAGVAAFVSTRSGGYSDGAWESFNLGLHVQDDPVNVQKNRALLQQQLLQNTGLSDISLQWLQQVHSNSVFKLQHATVTPTPPQADAIYTKQTGVACAVLTADCLPVLFCSDDGAEIAVAHAGWRGLLAGVLENTLAAFSCKPEQIRAWLGPAIGPCHFEVGAEVKSAFMEQAMPESIQDTSAAFKEAAVSGKYLADLYELARIRMTAAGVVNISGKVNCTVCDTASWYSYRHNAATGRFATLIVKTC